MAKKKVNIWNDAIIVESDFDTFSIRATGYGDGFTVTSKRGIDSYNNGKKLSTIQKALQYIDGHIKANAAEAKASK